MHSFAQSPARLLGVAIALVASGACANPLPDHFAYDLSFNGGNALDDRFATGPDTPHFAERILQLPNGEVVVAGLAPVASQTGNFVPGNIGLVHYGANGQRIGWTNPQPAYATYFNIYITFPNELSAQFQHIADIEYFDGHIFLLADYQASAGDRDVYVVVMNPDGNIVGAYGAFTTGLYEFGAALVPYSYTLLINGVPTTQRRMIAVANYDSGGPHWIVTMKRFSIDATGALSVDNSFGHIGNGAIDQPLPVGFCEAGTANACSGAAVDAVGVRTDSGTPTLYLLGNVDRRPPAGLVPTTDAFVMAVDGSSGDLVGEFGDAGLYGQALQIGNYSFGSYNTFGPAKRILASGGGDLSGDLLYFMTANNAFQSCSHYGAAIYKVRARVGPPFDATLPDFNWADGGKATLAARPQCVSPDVSVHLDFRPSAMALDGTTLAVSGQSFRADNVLSTVRFSDGEVTAFERYQWLRPNGTYWENIDGGGGLDSGYADIAATGDGRWTVTGTICDATAAVACALYGTTRLWSDEIFGNGYD